jgi:hypothetical protein
MLSSYWLGGWRKEHLPGTNGLVMMQYGSNHVGHAHADPMTKYKTTPWVWSFSITHTPNVCTPAVIEKNTAAGITLTPFFRAGRRADDMDATSPGHL